jgi:hypothetical protein
MSRISLMRRGDSGGQADLGDAVGHRLGLSTDWAAMVSMPMMALRGVRISWYMRERKLLLAAGMFGGR